MIKTILLFFIFTLYSPLYGTGRRESTYMKESIKIQNIEQFISTETLHFDNIKDGPYYIMVDFSGINLELLRSEHLTTVIVDVVAYTEKKRVPKTITIDLKKGSLGVGEVFFDIPRDFFWRSDVSIDILSIQIDEEFLKYYNNELTVRVKEMSRFFR